MMRMLAIMYLSIACLAGAEEAEVISEAFQQLSQIHKVDAPGFDACADVLLVHREEALRYYAQHHEELKQSARQVGLFQLSRMHDMLLWPMDQKGIIVSNVYNPRIASMGCAASLGSGAVS